MAEQTRATTQSALARQGIVTDAMRRVAQREGLDFELIRSELAQGRLIIPANRHHLSGSLDPMGIGMVATVKINANMGNSALTSNAQEELKKLHMAVHYGADTVMDLSTGGYIAEIRKQIIEAKVKNIIEKKRKLQALKLAKVKQPNSNVGNRGSSALSGTSNFLSNHSIHRGLCAS